MSVFFFHQLCQFFFFHYDCYTSSDVKLSVTLQKRWKCSILSFTVSHPSTKVSYLLFVDQVGEHRERCCVDSWAGSWASSSSRQRWCRWDGWDRGWSAGRLKERRTEGATAPRPGSLILICLLQSLHIPYLANIDFARFVSLSSDVSDVALAMSTLTSIPQRVLLEAHVAALTELVVRPQQKHCQFKSNWISM